MVKTRRLYLLLSLTLGLLCSAAETSPSGGKGVDFSEAQRANRFFDTFAKWAQQDGGTLALRDAVLCIGSSSMRGWRDIEQDLAPATVIHRGFGGSTMADVMLFKDFFMRYDARTILVYEGDNDLAGKNPDADLFLERCRDFAEAVFTERPDTRIYFLAIKPSPRREYCWPLCMETNTRLKAFCESDERLGFIDIAEGMLQDDGSARPEIFLKDRLHMNRKGYLIWRDAVREALFEEEKPETP